MEINIAKCLIMRIIILIFILFGTQSMIANNFNNNGHDREFNPQGLSCEHSVVANNINMEHYKNLSLENIVQEIDGIVYTEEWKDISGFEGLFKLVVLEG